MYEQASPPSPSHSLPVPPSLSVHAPGSLLVKLKSVGWLLMGSQTIPAAALNSKPISMATRLLFGRRAASVVFQRR